MKCVYLINILLLVFISCEETQESKGEGEGIPENAAIIPYENSEGLAKAQVFEGDMLIAEGDVSDGMKHGTWVTFDASGLITSATTFYKGFKQGASIEMDNQGYVSVYANYAADELNGTYKVYNRRRLIEERNYVAGRLEGELKKYYQDVTLMEESNYKDGQLDGIAKWFNTEGDLSIAYEYQNGELINQEAEVE